MPVRVQAPDWWSPSHCFEPDLARCNLCGTGVGPTTARGDTDNIEWRPFVEVQVEEDEHDPGDLEPTRLCEDCYGWLEEVAPAIVAHTEATTQAQERTRASLTQPQGTEDPATRT